MPDAGFGSPSTGGLPSGEWGHGSPTPASWDATTVDTGFGSPQQVALPVVVTVTGGALFPDEGGSLVTLRAFFFPVIGPYEVRLLDANGGVHPVDDNCYSAVPGQRDKVYAVEALDTMTFALPPLPPGTYDLRLRFDPKQEIVVPGALRVMIRNRHGNTYRVRATFPPVYAVGPRSIREEPTVG